MSHALELAAAPDGTSGADSPIGAPVYISVLVTVGERPDSLVDLYHECSAPLRTAGMSFEFVFVAEPWHGEATRPLTALARGGEPIRIFHAGQTLGETLLLRAGLSRCRGSVILTLPAYHRIHAERLIDLIRSLEDGADVAVARRWPRRDSWVNRLQNRVFHWLLEGLTGGSVRDIACGVRAMRKEVLEEIPLYGDFGRFLPLLAQRAGYRLVELEIAQHPADRRARIYPPGVYLRRLIDLLNLYFLLRFTEKPLRFFGLLGSGAALTGGLLMAVLLAQRLGGQGIADRPLLLLALLLIVLGVQAVALGLVGEIIVHLQAPRRRLWRLRPDEEPVAGAAPVPQHHDGSTGAVLAGGAYATRSETC